MNKEDTDYTSEISLEDDCATTRAATDNADTLYEQSKDIDDEQQRLALLQDAAALGHEKASYHLAMYYDDDRASTISTSKIPPPDYKKALYYYHMAADRGHMSALQDLACWYATGCAQRGINKNVDKSWRLFQQKKSVMAQWRVRNRVEKTKAGRRFQAGLEMALRSGAIYCLVGFRLIAFAPCLELGPQHSETSPGAPRGSLCDSSRYFGQSYVPRERGGTKLHVAHQRSSRSTG